MTKYALPEFTDAEKALFDAVCGTGSWSRQNHFTGTGGSWVEICQDTKPRAAVFYLSPLPGNDAIMVFHNVYIRPDLRGHGLGSMLHHYRLRCAKLGGAVRALCTVRLDNTVENAIMRKFHWTKIEQWDSAALWCKDLTR